MILQLAVPHTALGAFATKNNDLMGIIAFAGAAVGMIIGSHLKPATNVATT
jgi:hypothetical protein